VDRVGGRREVETPLPSNHPRCNQLMPLHLTIPCYAKQCNGCLFTHPAAADLILRRYATGRERKSRLICDLSWPRLQCGRPVLHSEHRSKGERVSLQVRHAFRHGRRGRKHRHVEAGGGWAPACELQGPFSNPC
jgi:hypothetical protein